MIRLKGLPRDEAKKIIAGYDNLNDEDFEYLIQRWKNYNPELDYDESFRDFRHALIETFKATLDETNGRINYLLDLRMGLKLYSLLSPESDFSIVQANDDDIWRYISVKVMPDITYLRYPDPEKAIKDAGGRLNHKRFYSHTRRIWLKSLWWYIHLSWQGDEKKTFAILKSNTVDNINKLIETPGRGYRLKLFRSMMAEYAATGPHKGKVFASFTKLNNAKCVLIEPALTTGGEAGYAKRLFEDTLNNIKATNGSD